ncbi:C40 family peptidase [Bacteroidota bacterium]
MNLNKNIIFIFSLTVLITLSCSPLVRFSTKAIHSYSNTKSFKKSSGYSSKHVASSKKSNNKALTRNTTNLNLLTNSSLGNRRKEVLRFAQSWLGTPYCYGGSDKSCTDCSGFVMQVYDMAGIRLPRTAALQYNFGEDLDEDEITPGDLVFFIRQNKIGHVGIYVGNDQFIHASSKRGVVLQNLEDDYYKNTFAGCKRVI